MKKYYFGEDNIVNSISGKMLFEIELNKEALFLPQNVH